MPYTLTEQEKQEIIQSYQDNVGALNAYLPEGQKIALDLKGLNEKLNNENLVRLYKKAQEVQANDKKRLDEYKRLINNSEEKRDPNRVYALDKSLYSHLKPGNTPEEKEYNKAVVNRYLENPEKFFKNAMKNETAICPTSFFKAATSNDPENYLLEYYENNLELCNDANGIDVEVLERSDILNNTSSQFGYQILDANKNTFGKTATFVQNISKDSVFTMPSVTLDQFNALRENGLHNDAALKDKLQEKIAYDNSRQDIVSKTKAFMENADRININTDMNNLFSNYFGYDRETEQSYSLFQTVSDGLIFQNRNIKIMQLSTAQRLEIYEVMPFDRDPDNQVFKHALPEVQEPREEQVKKMFKNLATDYAKEKNLTAAQRDDLTPKTILDSTKPGFLRSFVTNDSKEWKNFEYMYKAFYDKNNVYYQNTKVLRGEAKKYLEAKGVESLDDIEDLSGRSKQKALLCLAITENYQDLEPLKTAPNIEREQAIEDNSILEPQSQNSQPERSSQKQMEDLMNLEDEDINDLDMSVEK